MKQSNAARSKHPGSSTSTDDKMDSIEHLKKHLDASIKKCNSEKKRNEDMANAYDFLLQENSELKRINFAEQKNSKFWEELYSGSLSITKKATEIYCNIILESKEMDPGARENIELHQSLLKAMIDKLFQLSNKSDFLGTHAIDECLNNNN